MDKIRIKNQGHEYLCRDIGSAVGFEYSSTRVVIEDIASGSGSVFVASRFGRRNLSWRGLIKENVMVERRRLINACNVGRLKTIEFTSCDGIDLQAEVEILSLIAPYKLGTTIYQIEAVAPDFRFYSQKLKSENVRQSILQGGTSIPSDVPMSLVLNESDITEIIKVIVNEGNVDTDPIFTITGPGNGFIVTNVSTGSEFILAEELEDGESIVVDIGKRTVIKNGNENVYDSFSGDFWTLRAGENQLRFLVQSNFSDNSLLNLQFRSAYTGI